MMENVKKDLTGINIEHSKIHIEYFTAPAHHEEFIPEGAESTEIKDRIVTIILDGEEVTVNVPAGVSILNSAIKADLDPPFSCKSGICTTCRSKLYSEKSEWMKEKVYLMRRLKTVTFLLVSHIRLRMM